MLKVIEWNFRFFVGNVRLEIADDDDDLPIISVLLSFGNRKTCTVTWLINECFGKSFFFSLDKATPVFIICFNYFVFQCMLKLNIVQNLFGFI